MKEECAEFYRQRDARTGSYTGAPWAPRLSVGVVVEEEAANSAVGQLLLLGVVNMLCRLHRKIRFILPSDPVPLQIASLTDASTVQDAVLKEATAIDPCGDFTLLPGPSDVVLGIGAPAEVVSWYLGADRSIGFLDRRPVPLNVADPGSARGAAVAACLGASAAFAEELDLPTEPRRLSAWNLREGDEAQRGPGDLLSANVGRVLLVGAGAVAAGFGYWYPRLGGGGGWTVVDRDRVSLDNTNRGLLFHPCHAGWPHEDAEFKAEIVAKALDGEAVLEWYDEAPEATEQQYDLVLGLANDRGVRGLLAARNQPILLHATTGRNYLSQMHRHVAGKDDCIACRIPKEPGPMPAPCATTEVESAPGERHDAALPFLSAAAGLMLATSVQRLAAGELSTDPMNNCSWYFCSPADMAFPARSKCSEGCEKWWPPEVRARVYAGTRWAHLEEAPGGS